MCEDVICQISRVMFHLSSAKIKVTLKAKVFKDPAAAPKTESRDSTDVTQVLADDPTELFAVTTKLAQARDTGRRTHKTRNRHIETRAQQQQRGPPREGGGYRTPAGLPDACQLLAIDDRVEAKAAGDKVSKMGA